MWLSKRVEYSVRALVALALAEPATINARMVAETQDIPSGYLYDVLTDLRRVELVSVLRGTHGGYTLKRPASEITLGEIIRLLDGPPLDALRPAPGDSPTATRLRRLFDEANGASLRLLDEVTLADIAAS